MTQPRYGAQRQRQRVQQEWFSGGFVISRHPIQSDVGVITGESLAIGDGEIIAAGHRIGVKGALLTLAGALEQRACEVPVHATVTIVVDRDYDGAPFSCAWLCLTDGHSMESYAVRANALEPFVRSLLGDLLGQQDIGVYVEEATADTARIDLLASDDQGRRWLVEVKTSSGPAHVRRAAEQLLACQRSDSSAIALLVVPFMSSAGAQAAQDAGINWIDLSGNAHIRTGDLHIHVEGRLQQTRGGSR